MTTATEFTGLGRLIDPEVGMPVFNIPPAMAKISETEHRLTAGFPNVDPGLFPVGARVVVQLYSPPKTTRGGIMLIPDSVDMDQQTTLLGKVVHVSDVCFRERDTGERRHDYPYYRVGDYVRAQRFGGDMFKVKHGEDNIVFGVYNDDMIVAIVTDPSKFV